MSKRKTEIKMETTGYKTYNSRTGETHGKKQGKQCLRKMQRPSHYTTSINWKHLKRKMI